MLDRKEVSKYSVYVKQKGVEMCCIERRHSDMSDRNEVLTNNGQKGGVERCWAERRR